MNTEVNNFPRGLKVEDLLYLIYGRLDKIAGVVSPAEVISVSDITKIDGKVLDGLQVGDKVVKVTGVQKHLYLVTYKGEGVGEGICLSYNAAGYGETVSYDYTANGWVYNSTDVKTYGDAVHTQENVANVVPEEQVPTQDNG